MTFVKYNEAMELNYEGWEQPCQKTDCKKPCFGLNFVSVPAALGDDSNGSSVAPQNGRFANAIVRYESNGAVYIYSAEGVPVKVKEGE